MKGRGTVNDGRATQRLGDEQRRGRERTARTTGRDRMPDGGIRTSVTGSRDPTRPTLSSREMAGRLHSVDCGGGGGDGGPERSRRVRPSVLFSFPASEFGITRTVKTSGGFRRRSSRGRSEMSP